MFGGVILLVFWLNVGYLVLFVVVVCYIIVMNNFSYSQLFKLYARPARFLALRITVGILGCFLVMIPFIEMGSAASITVGVLVMVVPPVVIVFWSVRKFHKEIEKIKLEENLHFKGTFPHGFNK